MNNIGNWNFSSIEGIVILFDALGTKGIWKENNPQEILMKWDFFGQAIKDKIEKTFPNKTSCNIFSDTVIITIEGKLEDIFEKVSSNLFSIFVVGLAMKINLRGAITYGSIYKSPNSILGSAIDECSSFHNLPNLLGMVVCPTLYSLLEKNKSIQEKDKDFFFPKYDLPLKDHNTMKNVRMMRFFEGYSFTQHIMTSLPKEITTIKELIHYNIEHVDDIDAKLKWKNTLDFVNSIKLPKEDDLTNKVNEALKNFLKRSENLPKSNTEKNTYKETEL